MRTLKACLHALGFSRSARWPGRGPAILIGASLLLIGLVAAGPARAQHTHEGGEGHGKEAAAEAEQVITVEMARFRYHPDTLRIPAGKRVKLAFENTGRFPHEFMAGRSVTEQMHGYEHGLFEGVEVTKHGGSAETAGPHQGEPETSGEGAAHPEEHGGHHDEGGHAESGHGTMIQLSPGSSGSLVFRLPASKKGIWEMGCFLRDPKLHYRAGMRGAIIVN